MGISRERNSRTEQEQRDKIVRAFFMQDTILSLLAGMKYENEHCCIH